MKRLIFLLLKKLKINKEYLFTYFIKNKIKLELVEKKYFYSTIDNVVEFEKFIDSVARYIIYKEPGLLYNLAELKEKEKVIISRFFTIDGYYIDNIDTVNLRILNKINKIREDYLKLEPYYSKSLKAHIIIVEEYLSVVL